MEKTNKPLAIPLMGITGTRLSKHSLREHLTNSKIQSNTLQLMYNKFHPDGIFTFMDLTVEAEALGLKIIFPEHDTPSVSEHPVKNGTALNNLKAGYNGINSRMNVFVDVVRELSSELDTTIGAYVIGPFSLAGEMNGVNDLLVNTLMDPEFVLDMIEFSVQVISDYANSLFEAGADTVCVLEPTSVMLSDKLYEQFSLQPFKKIAHNVNHQPLILHICGDTTHLIDKMCLSGASALSLDSLVDFKSVAKRIPADINLIGNIDPVEHFLNGDSHSMCKHTNGLLNEMAEYPNFILSSGCDLPLNTPMENIQAFMDTAKKIY